MLKKFKQSKVFTIFFTLSLIISLIIPIAMNALVLTRTDSYRVLVDGVADENITAAVKKFADGQYGFCLEYKKIAPDSGTDLKPGRQLTDPEIWKTMKFGYPNQTWYNTGDPVKDEKLNFYVTQVALWYFINDWPMEKIDRMTQARGNAKYEAIKTNPRELKGHIRKLISQVENDKSSIEPSVEFSKAAFALTGGEGEFTKSELIAINATNLKGNATITLVNAPAGAYVENEQGQKTNSIPIGGKFRIVVPSGAPATNIGYKITGNATTLQTIEYASQKKQDIVKFEEVNIPMPLSDEGKITWTPGTGKAQIQKVDEETGNAIPGVVFDIKQGEEVKQTVTTNEKGLADLELKVGDYTVVEKSAPENYVIDSTPKPVKITNTGEVIPIKITNKQVQSKVHVNKIDKETKEPLPGAEFVLKQNGEVKFKAVSNESGRASFDKVPFGTYQLEESKPPEGYLRNKASKEIVINRDTNGKTLSLEVTNQVIKGKIQIVKVDGENEEVPIKGAKFNVYKADNLDKEIATITTDENGFAFTEDLRYGDYVLKEIDAPGDYYINDKLYPVSIRENGKVVVQYIVNQPVKFRLQILKVDGENKQPLKGAHFQIHQNGKPVEFTYQVGNNIVKEDTFVSDENGVILLPKELKGGKYQLVEVKAPAGYKLMEPIDFEITRDTEFTEDELGKIFTIEVDNTPIKGNVQLLKVDSKDKDKKLEGVKFELYKTSTLPVVDENNQNNNENENIVEKVINGVRRLFVKEGNDKPSEEKPVEEEKPEDTTGSDNVTGDNTEQPVVDPNKPSDNLLTEEQKPLENGDQLIGIYVTDSNGQIRVNDLRFGNYYFKEVETLEGYVLSDKPLPFSITEDGKTIELVMENEKITGTVEISKIDVATSEALPNTGIRIYLEDKETVIYEGRTDENGILTFGPLEYGKYYFQEFDAPEGYVLDEQLFPFEIKENGEIVKCQMTNKKAQGTLEITKVAAGSGVTLSDARFAIYDESGEKVVAKGTTDENGIATFKLDCGKYYYQEIEAPAGFMVDNNKYPFEIKEDGEIVKVRMTNGKLPKTGAGPLSQIALFAPFTIVGLTGAYTIFRKKD